MTASLSLRIYLEEPLRQSAMAGQHNFINLIAQVARNARFRVEYHPPTIIGAPDVHSLSHMTAPPNAKGLVFRRVYHYPFWQIEASAERWRWDVAGAKFDLQMASTDAPRFYNFWRKRLFGDAALNPRRDGHIYVPLQGRLDRQRSFQACSPFEMIEHCLRYDRTRRIVATLHPKEHYTETELSHLERLERANPRLSIHQGEMIAQLQTCDYVVTQNSSAAFSGYFFGKPALLFGQIDFHHIAVKADMNNLPESFARVADHAPAYAQYIWWFWQDQSINAGKPDAAARIASRLERFGWPMK